MKANIHLKSLLALVRRLRQKQDSRPTVPRMRLKIEQKNQTHRCFGGANSIPPSLGLQQLALYVHIYCSLDGGLCWPSKRCWSKSKKDQDSKRCLNSSKFKSPKTANAFWGSKQSSIRAHNLLAVLGGHTLYLLKQFGLFQSMFTQNSQCILGPKTILHQGYNRYANQIYRF